MIWEVGRDSRAKHFASLAVSQHKTRFSNAYSVKKRAANRLPAHHGSGLVPVVLRLLIFREVLILARKIRPRLVGEIFRNIDRVLVG